MRPEQIPYGVKDFKRIRLEDFYYVDKTAFIRRLEARANFLFFVRPRRFGKSLLCETLRCYYDVAEKGNFDRLFGGLDIGKDPTANASRYFVLSLDFSYVNASRGETWSAKFENYLNNALRNLIDGHRAELSAVADVDELIALPGAGDKFDVVVPLIKRLGYGLYVIVDEYDNFTNEIVSTAGKAPYKEITHGTGFYRGWFKKFKGTCDRIFMTGVSPVTMDDLTSGFNIATNISMDPTFAALTGFTQGDIREMLAYYRANAGFAFDEEAVYETMCRWYDNYRFSPDTDAEGKEPPHVANPTLVLYYMQYFLRNHKPQRDLVDENLRTDYMKIRHIITEGRRVNGNFHRLEDIISRLGTTATLRKSFQARELGVSDNFVSFLFYNGLVTVTGEGLGRSRLGIPNLTVGEFMHDFVPRAYQDVHGVDPQIFDIANGMTDFAETGDWHGALDTASAVVSRYWKCRDAIEGERVVQTALCSLLYVGHGPYIVRHEPESGGGFVDIAFEPQLNRWPQIGHAALVELKYLKKDADASPEALAKLRAEASDQIARYASDHDLARAWNLREGGGTVALHRIVIVFHGGDIAICEEVKG